MSVGLDPSVGSPVATTFPVRRFTVEEYHRLADSGVLGEEDRVELLEGVVSPKVVSPKMVHKPPHDATVELVDEAIRNRLPEGWRVRIQSAISTEDSEPEPDVAVVRGSARERTARHPGPEDIGLLIEVAESSLERDRNKRRIYAAAGIREYWIVNLVDACVEVYSEPRREGEPPMYGNCKKYVIGEEIPASVWHGDAKVDLGAIAVAELLS